MSKVSHNKRATKVAKPQIFNDTSSKVSEFILTCKLYIRIKLREKLVKEQICCSNHLSLKDKWSHNEQSSPMGYQVTNGGITRELDKEPSLHCSFIYITYRWSMLQQCVYLMSIHHASTLRPPCFLHMPWRHTFNLHYTCAHHVYTMRNPCPLTSSSNPNSF